MLHRLAAKRSCASVALGSASMNEGKVDVASEASKAVKPCVGVLRRVMPPDERAASAPPGSGHTASRAHQREPEEPPQWSQANDATKNYQRRMDTLFPTDHS